MADSGKLTAVGIKAAKPGKHFDGGGLYLEVRENGAKYWRLKYRFAGRENRLSFGVYPEVSLGEARSRRADARALLRSGKDPGAERDANRDAARRDAEGAFPVVAAAWLDFKKREWADESYRKASYVTYTYLIPALRQRSIATLTTKQAADVLADIAMSARRLLTSFLHCGGRPLPVANASGDGCHHLSGVVRLQFPYVIGRGFSRLRCWSRQGEEHHNGLDHRCLRVCQVAITATHWASIFGPSRRHRLGLSMHA